MGNDRIPINDAEPSPSNQEVHMKFDDSILSHGQSMYKQESIITTVDTTNSNLETKNYESNVILESEEVIDREKEKQNQLQEPEPLEIEERQAIEKEGANEQQEVNEQQEAE